MLKDKTNNTGFNYGFWKAIQPGNYRSFLGIVKANLNASRTIGLVKNLKNPLTIPFIGIFYLMVLTSILQDAL